jgi:hypothetical protein
MTKIYDQFDAAFTNVSAYVVLDAQGALVAKIAFKYPRDGAGRLYAYVHWLGLEMVRGYAGGGGYDKHSAACASAARRITNMLALRDDAVLGRAVDFREALLKDDGAYWHWHLEKAGFTLHQAV